MRNAVIAILFCFIGYNLQAQNATQARKILDKSAAVIGRKGGAAATFSINSPQYGSVKGSIAIKGRKYHATTPQHIIWYDGKTLWSYMKSTNEVSISTPSGQQNILNPYSFIYLYKQGYTLSYKNAGNSYDVHLISNNKKQSFQELFILINKASYIPSRIKIKQGGAWTTITINSFQAKNQPDATFVFRQKDFPKAEIIDLR